MPTPHARDAGLRRITSITGWVAAAAVSAVALISVGVARASANATSKATSPTADTGVTDPGVTDPGFTRSGQDDPWGSTGSSGLQPPVNPPTQGLGGGQAVSGGS